MFSVVQQLNALSSSVTALGTKVSQLSIKLQEHSNETDVEAFKEMKSGVDDVKKVLSKLQLDVASKQLELKKELDVLRQEDVKKTVAKEFMLLETTLLHKVQQSINKSLKERFDTLFAECKAYVDSQVLAHMQVQDTEAQVGTQETTDSKPSTIPNAEGA